MGMNYGFKTASEIFDWDTVSDVIEKLVQSSQWFEFTPYPDGEYMVTVKEENRHMIENW